MLLKSGDFLGGIFGNELGISNTYLHILLILILILSVVNYVSDNSSLVILTSYIVSTLYVAALSELKIIFVELPIIIILTLLFKRLGIKILLKIISITCIVVVALAISIPILYELFPIFDNFFKLEKLFGYSTGNYSTSSDFGRLSSIVQIISTIFYGDVWQTLFGIGLGEAEISKIPIFSGSFYYNYEYTHYYLFTLSYVFIENGFIGLFLFMFMPIYLALKMIFERGTSKYDLLLIVLSISLFMLLLYNNTMRSEIYYLYLFVLSWGVAINRGNGGCYENNKKLCL
ncbi:polymerase [Streptococcus pneumoniae]|uniref:polymerase n=1 Tax=Streptococcus pneumoniae TaxID=1313 RepID=UPI001CDC05ED|nr:polymerase [Streptococcus pneumoniae]MDS2569611.1 polymerase [Streptococcus pneumoniae]BDS87771.1 hypothetical protein PC1520_03400 [Streptococcus pneumoniae]BEL24172.1 hypothetical protein TKY121773_03400 [Streptococcus pneumoniae]BEL28410.1 hypothetical protein TKY120829_03300 [Streptococcus pneumoniae]